MRKLAAVGLSYAAAIFLSCYLVPRAYASLAAFLSLLLIIPALFMRDTARLRLILVGVGLAVGFIWSAAYDMLFLEPERSVAGSTQLVEGRVVDFSRRYERGVSFTLRLTTKGAPSSLVRCMIWDNDTPEAEPALELELEPGDLVQCKIAFRNAEFLDEYLAKGYSTKAYLSGNVDADSFEVTGRSRLTFIYAPLYLARAVNEMAINLWPEDVAPFMAALLTGERGPLNENAPLTAHLGRSGILHVVAVSGTHVTFLVGLVSMLFNKRRSIVAACVPIIIVFMLMTGMNASVVRASLMQLFVLVAPLINREADALTSFSAVLTLLLLVNPTAGYDIGLQLSFASVLGLLLFAERIQEPMQKRAEKKLKKNRALAGVARVVISSFACTVAALVFTTPLSAIYFGYVPLYSVLTNILTLWMVTLEFTAGVIICVLGAVFPLAGMMLASVAAWGVRYILLVVRLVSGLPFAALYTSFNLAAWWIVFVYVVFFNFYILRSKSEGFRPIVPSCLSLTVLAAVLFVSLTRAPGIAAVDVGQGQSIVFVSNSGAVVVDCGGPAGSRAGEATAEYLLSRNRHSVELLVLTHLHADHANGAAVLMGLLDVQKLVIPLDAGNDDKMLAELLEAARETGTKVFFLAGDTGFTLGEMRFELYAPIGAFTKNERGIIVAGAIGELDALITGDVDAATERRLIAGHELERFELLVVGHHGSRYSTSMELLELIEPVIAFISVGNNSYGHPTSAVLERLRDAGAMIYRTDLHGNIEASIR